MSAAEHLAREEWRDIPDYEGAYQASNLGRIRSHSRRVASRHGTRVFAAAILTAIKTNRGYMMVNLSVDQKRKQMPVHRAVLLAFIGIPPDGYEACHNNGTRDDNRLENLRWDTRLANAEDRARHGNDVVGERNGNSVLTEAMVRLIRDGTGKLADIARALDIPYSTAQKVKYRDTWKHVR